MQKLAKNVFNSGLNTDLDKQALQQSFYTGAHNLELVSDGNFLALKNVRGTTFLKEITAVAGTEVLKVVDSLYTIDSVAGIQCLTIFTAKNSGLFKIWCYDTENDNLYELYEESVDANYISDDRIIDAKVFAENGIDIVYFTDNLNEVRQLRCEIVFPYSANFLNEYDLSLQRRGANGTISLISISDTGGSLLSGTYQFAYRMVDPDTKRFTKWSSLTNPIHIYAEDSVYNKSYAGIGLPTPKKIIIGITPTTDETDNFDYFQLAVVENIYPLNESSLVASLLPIELNAELTSYEYKNNTKIGTVPIEDVVVDLASVETAKTLAIKQSKLYLGNVQYRPLEFDNGEPEIGGGSIITVTDATSTPYWIDSNSSNKRGYFRDEVYRFGIVYYDKYGNKSQVKTLDLSSVTNNQISGAIDMKFPSRSYSNTYSLLDSNDSPVGLGLRLTDIVNHPSWAVGFEIVRVKRIKKILFQTPIIPMTIVEGIGTLETYPATAYTAKKDEYQTDYPNAKPMTSSKVYVPKNLMWPENRAIVKRESNIGTTDLFTSGSYNTAKKGESRLTRQSTYEYGCVFPQSTMYGDTPFVFAGNEQIETIDYCALRLDVREFDSVTNPGNHMNTKVSGTFHAIRTGDYYYDAAHSGKASISTETQLTDYTFVDNLAENDTLTLGGEKILGYQSLATEGISGLGFTPTTQKMGVVKLRGTFTDEGSTARTFANVTWNNYAGAGKVTNQNTISYQTSGADSVTTGTYTNSFVYDTTQSAYSSFANNNTYCQQLRIVNVIKGEVSDTRYGDVDDIHEFISTGTKRRLTASEVTNNTPITVDVWGGDCFVGFHVFKVCDSTYAVVNQKKNNGSPDSPETLRDSWNRLLFSIIIDGVNPNPKVMMPVALEKVAQFVQVCIESEYNGEVMDYDVLTPVSTISSTPILNVESEGAIRTPLVYNYNINLSKQNDQKVYFPKPSFTFEQNDFAARILISEQKIYNSDQQGFDIFKVLNFFDLEEGYGKLTALRVAGDRLYAIQERGILDLPTGTTQIEQTDGGTLSVGTGSDIGRPIVIDANRGGQHLGAIIESGGILFVPDVRNKAIYQIGGQELKPISSVGNDTLFRELFGSSIVERNLIGLYDPVRKQYWIADNNQHKCYIFSEMFELWQGNFEFSATAKLLGGANTNQKMYLLGKVSDAVNAYEMYTGNYGQLFGETVTPRVTFVVNPDADFSKTFDNLMAVATERLDTVDCVVEREAVITNQVVNGMNFDVLSQEGNFRIKTMRDGDSARLRGLRLLTTIKWKTTNVGSTLSSVLTKYRLSSRTPY